MTLAILIAWKVKTSICVLFDLFICLYHVSQATNIENNNYYKYKIKKGSKKDKPPTTITTSAHANGIHGIFL